MNRKVIINTSNLQKGGALQVAASFVREAAHINHFDFHVILGKASSEIIKPEHFRHAANMSFYSVDIHPSESIMKYYKFRKALYRIEKTICPKAVITVFGPCYWKPKAPHIIGFANGYLLYEDTYFFTIWNGWRSLKYKVKKRVQQYLLRTEANKYWTETEDSKKRLSRFLRKPEESIIVATNNCSHYFREPQFAKFEKLPPKSKPRLLYISSYYPHKGFELLPPILERLKEAGIDVELVVTIQEDDFVKIFKGLDIVINLGTVAPKYCPYLYQQSDVIIVPTLLETFTAVYPEAMYSGKPILTTYLPFARSICGDAALYFDPLSTEDAVSQLSLLLSDVDLRNGLIEKGFERVKEFDLPSERFAKILKKILE